MKDTTAGTDIGVFRITARKDLPPGSWHDGWTCANCGAVMALQNYQRTGPGPILRLEPAGSHVRLACPKCGTERLYGINEREVIQVPSS